MSCKSCNRPIAAMREDDIARAVIANRDMLNTLTRTQEECTKLLERARKAEWRAKELENEVNALKEELLLKCL